MARGTRTVLGLATIGVMAWLIACGDPASPGDDDGDGEEIGTAQ